MDAAVEHFSTAAQSGSEAGRNAQGELVRLDLPRNPTRYVATRTALDSSGYVWVEIGNRTRVALRDIELTYAWIDSRGQTRRDVARYRGTLAGGKSDRVRLGLQLPDAGSLQQRFRVEVTGARIAD